MVQKLKLIKTKAIFEMPLSFERGSKLPQINDAAFGKSAHYNELPLGDTDIERREYRKVFPRAIQCSLIKLTYQSTSRIIGGNRSHTNKQPLNKRQNTHIQQSIHASQPQRVGERASPLKQVKPISISVISLLIDPKQIEKANRL